MKHLQVVLKVFDSIAAPNEETLIHYFQDGFRPFIEAQVENRRQDLNAWKEVIEKAVNTEAKISLQTHSMIREINSRCPKTHRPLVMKDKNNAYWEYRNKASNKGKKKAKSHPSSFANQPQIQASKKNKHHRTRQGHLATGINTTEIVKKDKNKAKDLSHIKCYTYKQKDHYMNKCLKKQKN